MSTRVMILDVAATSTTDARFQSSLSFENQCSKLLTQYDKTLKTKVLGKGIHSGSTFIDLSKAFNRLNHNLLLPKFSMAFLGSAQLLQYLL